SKDALSITPAARDGWGFSCPLALPSSPAVFCGRDWMARRQGQTHHQPYNASMSKTRSTDRKRILQAVLTETAGSPIVLEELRWRVMRRELAEEKEPVASMTEAYQKSFNRTLRMFLSDLAPGISIHRIEGGWTAGLVARVAVYRLE